MHKKYVSPILEKIRGQSNVEILENAYLKSSKYINNVDGMRVFPSNKSISSLSAFDKHLEDNPQSANDIIDELDSIGSPATVAQTGGKYFGFVNGGVLPVAIAAKYLLAAWDQNPALYVMSPVVSKIEDVTEKWIIDILRLPKESVVGFVSGSSIASLIGLTTGRNYIYKNLGYEYKENGMTESPRIKVIIGDQAHSTIWKALSIIGFGTKDITIIPSDSQGRMRLDKLPKLDNMSIVILQAGNVNSGAFDDFQNIISIANKSGAYVHVDGAFGLWARASRNFDVLTQGLELADSWSADGHKTLNSPYDNGLIISRHRDLLVESLHMDASYIKYSNQRDGMLYTADMSRRSRAAEIWATMKALGKQGIVELVDELCAKATYFSYELSKLGLEILNDVVFNQVIIHYKDNETTNKLINLIQESGLCWMGGSSWQGKSVMRISVSSYKTTYGDIDECVELIKIIIKEI